MRPEKQTVGERAEFLKPSGRAGAGETRHKGQAAQHGVTASTEDMTPGAGSTPLPCVNKGQVK